MCIKARAGGDPTLRSIAGDQTRNSTMPELHGIILPSGRSTAASPGLAASGACADCSLLVEADHRIANHLAMLRSYLHLEEQALARRPAEVSRDSVRLLLAGLDAQIVAVSELHRVLAARGRQTSADLAEQLHRTCAPFQSGLSGAVTITEDFEDGCLVAPDQVLPVTQIVAEALTNALKHGPAQGGAVRVRCRRGALGGALIEVIDDGPGFPPGFDPTSDGGLGFRVLRGLSKQLGALMAFKTSPRGVKFQLALPPLSSSDA
jgi:two-component sensor histidine kinase